MISRGAREEARQKASGGSVRRASRRKDTQDRENRKCNKIEDALSHEPIVSEVGENDRLVCHMVTSGG